MNRPDWLDPDPLTVEPDPDHYCPGCAYCEPPMSPRTKGCLWATLLGASAVFSAVVIFVGVSLVAPSEAQSPAVSSPAGTGLRGAPHPANPTAGFTLGVVSEPATGQVPGGAPPIASLPASSPTGEIGTALYSASATWCAPTPTQCGGWGGNARLGAVFTFRFGDEPWWARVWRGERFVDVLVVSHCACRGTDAAIDLSPAAFAALAPLSRGRIAVAVEVLDWPGDSEDPPPHPDDERMRQEAQP